MSDRDTFAAEILETSATALASAANAALQEKLAGTARQTAAWKTHLTQRILELAAAVRVSDPALFTRRVEWTRRAYKARGSDESELSASLESLRDASRQELPKEVIAVIQPTIDLAIEALSKPIEAVPDTIDPATDTGRLALEYMKTCLEGRTEAAIELVMAAIGRNLTPESALLDVLIPAQHETGQLWHTGEVSIAEEHLVSETTRQLIAIIVREHAPKPGDGRLMLAASVAGNAHDIGLRIVSELYRLAGWRCLFLGANVPSAEIARAVGAFDVDLVLLNAAMATQLKEVGETIDAIRETGPAVKILVGGHAFEDSPELWRKLGADGFARDAASAVEAGAALLER